MNEDYLKLMLLTSTEKMIEDSNQAVEDWLKREFHKHCLIGVADITDSELAMEAMRQGFYLESERIESTSLTGLKSVHKLKQGNQVVSTFTVYWEAKQSERYE